MEFEGKVWRDGKIWLIEVPSLNLMTQGKTRKDAFKMIRDASMGLIECYFEAEMGKKFGITVKGHLIAILEFCFSEKLQGGL